MKLMIGTIIWISLVAWSARAQTYHMDNKEITKVEALLALAKNKSAVVYKCQQQELSDKATIRNKKQTKPVEVKK